MRRDVATIATIIRTMAPKRSDQGARLKKAHHTTIARPPTTPPMTAYSSKSGTTLGRTNRISHCNVTAATPGQSRSGFRSMVTLATYSGHSQFVPFFHGSSGTAQEQITFQHRITANIT